MSWAVTLVDDFEVDLVDCARCDEPIETPLEPVRTHRSEIVCSACAADDYRRRKQARLAKDVEPLDANAQWERCYAVKQGWRECKGPMDCDGTCWRGLELGEQPLQARLFEDARTRLAVTSD